MCGIFGGHVPALMERPEELLRHRGPDQQGRRVLSDRLGRPFVFGMTRLNVVDRRDMPVPYEAAGALIAFNGEIYNWRDLRRELEAEGVRFGTETDTELALHAYLRWGPACLDRFNGMFAFAVWREGELFLARDRLGKKPLFYANAADGFAFGSELKVFRHLELAPVDICERLEFYFDEMTPFAGVASLRPGEYLLYDTASGELRTHVWWRFPSYDGSITSLDEALDAFLPLFEDACQLRRVADVPVTLFLSGGVDSSLIQAMLRLETTYTVQFPELQELIDEESLVREFAATLGFDAHVLKPTREEFLECFPQLARYIEFPVGSFSVFPLYSLAQHARQDGFEVALSGEGADEFFNGYYRNEMLLREDALIAEYLQGPYRHLASRYFGSPLERLCRMASRNGLADIDRLQERFAPLWNDSVPLVHNIAVIESLVFLQPLLTMADRMSMAHGLEVRNPFMDHRLVELSARLAPGLRYRDGHGKFLLRAALRRLVGDDRLGVCRREVKHGLPSPVNTWLLKKNNFDRTDWNRMMLGECLRQLSRR